MHRDNGCTLAPFSRLLFTACAQGMQPNTVRLHDQYAKVLISSFSSYYYYIYVISFICIILWHIVRDGACLTGAIVGI